MEFQPALFTAFGKEKVLLTSLQGQMASMSSIRLSTYSHTEELTRPGTWHKRKVALALGRGKNTQQTAAWSHILQRREIAAKLQLEIKALDSRMLGEPATPLTLLTPLPMSSHSFPSSVPSPHTSPGLPQAGHPHGSNSRQVRRPGLACKQTNTEAGD